MRSILVPAHFDVDAAPQLNTALHLAEAHSAVVDVLYVDPTPELAPSYVISVDDIKREYRHRAERARARYEHWREAQSGMPDPTCWEEQNGVFEAVLERRGRLADLIVLARPESHAPDTERAFDSAIFGSGRPCLVVTQSAPQNLLCHLLVAWNGSLEATRALIGAMPLLTHSGRVSIFTGPTTDDGETRGQELTRALARHGIQAHEIAVPEASGPMGAALLKAATAAEATLVVMGAYTHSRVRQRFLGGVTRHMLDHSKIPLLMAH